MDYDETHIVLDSISLSFGFFYLEIKEKILPVLVGPPESGGSASPLGFS